MRNEINRAGGKSRKNTLKTTGELDVHGLRVSKSVNHGFTIAANFRNYRLIEKSSRYHDDAGHQFREMARKIVVQMMDSFCR